MKKTSKRILAIVLSLNMLNTGLAFGFTDEMIFNDPVSNTYTGRDMGKEMIKNLNFNDVPANHWAKESIIRSGALDMVKGYDKNYGITGTVSKQEAIAFVVRIVGMEKEAQEAAIKIEQQYPSLRGAWSLGYMQIARDLEIITEQDYQDSIRDEQNSLDPNVSFIRASGAKREEIATYLVTGINSVYPNTLSGKTSIQGIYTFDDWSSTGAKHAPNVEIAVSNKIMYGDTNGNFRPKGTINRAEMAQIIRNLDSLYYNMVGIERNNGTVGGIKDEQKSTTGNHSVTRNVYIRNTMGKVDVFKYEMEQNSSPQAKNQDSVVLKNGKVGGFSTLTEQDEVEYLIDKNTNTVLYVNVAGQEVVTSSVKGRLQSINYETGDINILSDTGKSYIYKMREGLYKKDAGIDHLMIDDKMQKDETIVYGSMYELILENSIVRTIKFIGDITLIDETRGIVVDNNPSFGYISFIDNGGNLVTMNYDSSDMRVEKQMHYDLDDEVGYLDEVFPDYSYDPRDTTINAIEAGDIIFIRPFEDDKTRIKSVSASTNYIMKYGKVNAFNSMGDYYRILIQYEDGQTTWFDAPTNIFVSEDGKPKKIGDIQTGDYLKLLVNQAVIEPGHVMESVKEIIIEGNDRHITTVIKGQLAGINDIQKKLQIQNAQKFSTAGWNNYKQIEQINLSNKEIELYHNNNRISLDYALQYLKRSDGEVYVAMENSYTGEKVKKITFRNGTDIVLNPDSVLSTNPDGSFRVISRNDVITTDQGSIVVRDGRLVTGGGIKASDYATVALNDGNNAAVVSITGKPGYENVIFVRGRVNSVDEGKTFRVQSMSVLEDYFWNYSPVSRDYTIDYNTLYLNKDGFVPMEQFLDYTENSVIDKVFNIIVDGTKATHIIDSPYAKESMRGTIYEITDDSVKIKDAHYYNRQTGKWTKVSNKDNTSIVTIPKNCMIAKNNKVAYEKDLIVGNQIRIMTDKLPSRIETGINVTGYIIMVEK